MVVVAQQLCFDRGTVVAAVRRPLTGNLRRALRVEPVSYTHLTLPTKA